MNNPNSNFYLPNQPEYDKEFWNYIRGVEHSEGYLESGKRRTAGYVLPSVNDNRFMEALKKESLFRNIGTYVYSHEGASQILAKHSDASASWIPDGGEIPAYDGMLDFTEFSMEDHKLAAVLKMDANFLSDRPHIFSSFFIGRMARAFGKAENDGFINGTGLDMPTGILSENGAAIGLTASSLSFDSVIELYFSVDKDHRERSAWLMNDDTALALRLLKDDAGNYIWNHSNDTILGKPVYINNCMPSAAPGAKPIAFGDFSFYWIVERDPLSVRVLKEKFIESGQIGYMGYEFLDGKLIRPDAVKVLQINSEVSA
ncbi:MAG: phage major capsid protein [Oscillospiraceae bacterium]|nr:phage major capsid protein [Oscillospiraceae bacterium]